MTQLTQTVYNRMSHKKERIIIETMIDKIDKIDRIN